MKTMIVKLDLVGSGEYISAFPDGNKARLKLLKTLVAAVQRCYSDSRCIFPEGIVYSSQGNCIFLIIRNLNAALTETIKFMTNWFGVVDEYPDCRAIMAFSDIQQFVLIHRMELVSKGFDEISVLEKRASPGQILMTRSAYSEYKEYHNIITVKGEFEPAEGVVENYYGCSYTNPRLQDGAKINTIEELDQYETAVLKEIIPYCPMESLAISVHGLPSQFRNLFKEALGNEAAKKLEENEFYHISVSMSDLLKAHKKVVQIANERLKVIGLA